MKKVFYLVRHGDLDNPQNLVSCRLEPPFIGLNETGRAQLARIADFLADKKIDCIYHSPLLRTTESAKIISDKLKLDCVKEDVRLIERNVGRWHGRTAEEFIEETDYLKDPLNPGEGVEPPLVAGDRAKSLVSELLKAPGEKFVLVSHGDVLTGLIMLLENKTNLSDYQRVFVRRGSLYSAVFDSRWKVEKTLDNIFDSGGKVIN